MVSNTPPGSPGAGSVLTKFAETLGVFARRRPSLRGLWRNRHQRFDRVHTVLPSEAGVGEDLTMTLQAWDDCERLHGTFAGSVDVGSTDPAAVVPERVTFGGEDGEPAVAGDGSVRPVEGYDGVLRVEGVRFCTPGTQYVTFEYGGERFVSNPVRVTAGPPTERTYWGDIHCHSQFSDGAGSMEKGVRFGRDVMDLDVVAYTDHDTMGFFIPPQWQRQRMHRRYFDAIKAISEEFNDPGEFLTLFGYEWTKQPNMGGHVNVYFEDAVDAPLFDSLAADTRTYEALWSALRSWDDHTDNAVVTIPHHPAEAMYPFDFSAVDYDDEFAPLVEVYSQWGSSERPGSEGNPRPLAMGQGETSDPGHFVQDALALGNRVGLMASSDYHGPHPGHSLIHTDPHLPSLSDLREDGIGWGHIWRAWNERSYPGGLVGFRATELTRGALIDALRSRRVYGTSQPHRILLSLSINGVRVGEQESTVTVDDPEAERRVDVDAAGTEPLETVTVVKNNEPWTRFEGTDDPDADFDTYTLSRTVTDSAPVTGVSFDGERGTDADVYYVRVTQAGDGYAWIGPLWVEVDGKIAGSSGTGPP